MLDALGRTIDYLRVSVTDRCNLRCIYCMPSSGVEWKPHETILSFEETLRIVRLLAELGVRNIKITGGEPLVRKGVAGFIRTLRNIPGIAGITLTTNGILLDRYLDALRDGGIHGVNISLDALDPQVFHRITRRRGLAAIFQGMDRALASGIRVKINCVPLRGVNDRHLIPLASLAEQRPIAVRFIELMPLGAGEGLEPVPGAQVKALLEERFGPLRELPPGEARSAGNGPARYYAVPGFTGTIGLINPISDGFCETCNRLRLSAEGVLKPCLAHDLGLDLRSLIRSGASDRETLRAMTALIAQKPKGHTFAAPLERAVRQGMYTIGG
ncbi:MAG: GTP 3',8-cyclase MoaA [Treponema sp.]|jgi:cyclic pyranopterin phosphate synthase|nr:GTP 3',8-cyclase MoaA [Treponema sp.]